MTPSDVFLYAMHEVCWHSSRSILQQMLDFQNMYEDAVVALASAKKCQKTKKEVHANLVDQMKKDAAEARRARARAKAMLKRPAGLIPIANS